MSLGSVFLELPIWQIGVSVLVLTVVIAAYRYKRYIIVINKIPGRTPTLLLGNIGELMAISRQNRIHPTNVYVLESTAGNAVIFKKERIFRFWVAWWPNVAFFRPETVETLLNSSANIDKADDYDLLHPWLGLGLLTSTGEKWRSRRKLLTPAFHFRILEDFLPIMNEQSAVLVSKLKKETDKEWIDVVPFVTFLTLDIICESTMGVCAGAQNNSDSEYVKAVNSTSEDLVKRTIKPWYWNSFFYYNFTHSGRKAKKSLDILHKFTRQIIKEKKANLLNQEKIFDVIQDETDSDVGVKKRQAFLDLLLHHHIHDKSLSEQDIQEEVDTFMFEGHDTTAMGISWALSCIGLYPDIQSKIYEEIESIFGCDTDRPVTSEDLRQLKFLDCVLKESQRLFPSVPFISRKITEEMSVNGYTVPVGTTCFIAIYMLHRNPEVFPNPEVFDPDRFLPENCIGRHPFSYVPFSAGPRNCIGQKFALMEEKVAITNLLRNFVIHSLDPRDKVQCVSELVLRPSNPLRLQFKLRTQI